LFFRFVFDLSHLYSPYSVGICYGICFVLSLTAAAIWLVFDKSNRGLILKYDNTNIIRYFS
jgi:hypothetical protein